MSIMAGISGQVIKNPSFIMISRNFYSILRRLQVNDAVKSRRFSSTNVETDEPDPAPLFINEEVQRMLKILTRPDLEKVYRVRKDGRALAAPVYKFMTDKELKEVVDRAKSKVVGRIQMPPVVGKRKPINEIISKDPAIQGFDQSNYIFTDITFNTKNVDRLIVVREPDGVLRHANWDERFRMNQIYFPIRGRELTAPAMFSGEYFEDLLKREAFEFILNRACLQYDPDDPEYHRVTQAVYEAINETNKFNELRSTRHYGPLVFHLVWTKNIINLLVENITNSLIEDAALLIQLYMKIHPSENSVEFEYDDDHLKFVEKYVDLELPAGGKVQAAINAYKEIQKAKIEIEEGVKAAHGLN